MTEDKSCRTCNVDGSKCPFNAPPKIDGFEHLDVDYKHHRIDCEHHVKKMDIEEERYFVSLGMRTYASSFFKAIGDAIAHANIINLTAIKITWLKEWEIYLRMGKKEHEKNG